MTNTSEHPTAPLTFQDLKTQYGLLLSGGNFRISNLIFERPVAIHGNCSFDNTRIGAFTNFEGNGKCSHATIGRYCTIAANYAFGLPQHPVHWFSSYAFTVAGHPLKNATSHGIIENAWSRCDAPFNTQTRPLTIGNDIWIGPDVMFPGAKDVIIGDGAIIEARSVVTHDIPPYCVAAGNPARVLRQRFSDGIIADLLATKWWDFDLPACLASRSGLAESKFLRAPEMFVRWWNEGGRDLLRLFPLNREVRQLTLDQENIAITSL